MILVVTAIIAQVAAAQQQVRPVLAFPEPGLDDSTAYQGYRTRFLRDDAGNTVQIYLKQREGRVVNLWADAANASAGFTVRDARGRPAPLDWGSDGATVGSVNGTRFVEYQLDANATPLEIGRFLLGSMRLERDFQYGRGHLQPFDAPSLDRPELVDLITHLERLDAPERQRHLELLGAASVAELRSRLRPTIQQVGSVGQPIVRIEHVTFDGRNRLSLEFAVDGAEVTIDSARGSMTLSGRGGAAIALRVKVGTDAPTLGPLTSDEIFNADFWRFHARLRATAADATRFRRLDRQIRMTELVSSEEKLMAGLPNFATYFGRDMIMSALMMEPILSPAVLEHVIASVLRKLTSDGEVSHEEALGGQAIREHAAEYNALLAEYERVRAQADMEAAADALRRARGVLSQMQTVREAYHMVDDDFQFPVLVARYLANPAVAPPRKRAFLLGGNAAGGDSRLRGLLENLGFVARQAGPYALAPVTNNLIAFAKRPDGRWGALSWRDSGAGYGNGRFAMDVNAIWVPAALAATQVILDELERLGWERPTLARMVPGPRGAALRAYIAEPWVLRTAIDVWRQVRRHFEVELAPAEVSTRLTSWLDQLPQPGIDYWRTQPSATAETRRPLRFFALSLDAAGRPIPVVNTDPAMIWFLEDLTQRVLRGERRADDVVAELEPFVRAYPQGLFVDGLGPLVANDAFAAPDVQQAFRADPYHSPSVVWGREVNLFLLGLARQIAASYDSAGALQSPELADYSDALVRALGQTLRAVEASGLKHNELWSYSIEGGRLRPVRYATSSDIQLWNVTDLAVQYALTRLPAPAAALLREIAPSAAPAERQPADQEVLP